jgi:hypothetical protein
MVHNKRKLAQLKSSSPKEAPAHQFSFSTPYPLDSTLDSKHHTMVMLHYHGSWTQTLRNPAEIWNYTIIRKQNHPRTTTSRICSSPSSSKDPHHIIRDAERDLSDYCAALPGGEEADDCWRAYRFLDEELKSAEHQCELDSQDCRKLDKLEDTIREMVYSGEGSEGLAVALATLSRIRDKAKANIISSTNAAAAGKTNTDDPNNPEKQLSPFLQWRGELSNLFQQIDSNQDGKIDVEQLSQALKMLGEELDDEELRAALMAVDSHGWVDETDFITIAEAEKERSHDPFVEMWRHKKHVHHDKEGGGD